jgi:undecaprenyl-diphosphatase
MEQLNQFLYNLISARAGQHIFWDDAAVFLADFLLYFLILGAVLFFALERNWKKRWHMFLEASLAVILSRGILTELLHRFYEHPRPYVFYEVEPLIQSLGNSFPSGHMAFIWALAGVIFFYNRRWGTAYFVFSLLMGAGRVFAGVHWPLDILGGIFIGLTSALLVHRFLKNSQVEQAVMDLGATARSERHE